MDLKTDEGWLVFSLNNNRELSIRDSDSLEIQVIESPKYDKGILNKELLNKVPKQRNSMW